MAGQTVTVRREILAEPLAVWNVVTDIDRAARILTAVEKTERLAGGDFEVGTRWAETRREMGRVATEEMWVTEAVAPTRAVIASEAGGVRYSTVIECQTSSLGTTLVFTFVAATENAGVGQRLLFALIGKAGVKAAKSALERDLADIAAAVEHRARR
jgi:hypothetical protein